MRRPRTVRVFVLGLFLLAAGPATAQPVDAPAYLRRWLDAQADASRRIDDILVTEEAHRTIDGPFAVRRTRTVSHLSGSPRSRAWDRDVLEMYADGREVPPGRRERLEDNRRGMLGPLAEPFVHMVVLPYALLSRMTPSGSPADCTLDRVPCRRFELVPRRGERQPLQRLTLWFDTGRPVLLRSRAVVQPPRGGTSFVVTTDYVRIQGLDLPRFRNVEGSVQTRRRVRTFTMLVNFDIEYRDYRFTP